MMPQDSAWYRRWAWTVILAIAGFTTAFGIFVLFSPVNAADFEADTGIEWADFGSTQPAVAEYLEREGRIVAAVSLGLGLLTAGLAVGPLRRGDRGAWLLLWFFAGSLGLIAVVFFASDAAALGWYYVVLTAVTVVGLWLSRPAEAPLGAGE